MKFLIAGDFCVRHMDESFYTDEMIEKIASSFGDVVAGHDLSMFNNETVYSDSEDAISKSGPNLKSPHRVLDIIKKMGFDIAAGANNHTGDYGVGGLLDTIEYLEKNGFQVVGMGENLKAASAPLYVKKCGIKLAIVNCCEHEFGYAERSKPGSAPMDFYETGMLVKEAKQKADKVIAYVHGGNEHNPVPRPGMKKFCYHLAECGADAVIVTHSHCPQGMETYKDVPICYSLGNFYFHQAADELLWYYGYAATLNIEKDAPVTVDITPYKQLPEGIEVLQGEDREYFMRYIARISELLADEDIYEKMTLAWSKYYGDAAAGFLDGTVAAEDKTMDDLFWRNTYTCESHNELWTTFYKNYCEGNFDDETEKYIQMINKLQNYEII